jgi:hypothetical protein
MELFSGIGGAYLIFDIIFVVIAIIIIAGVILSHIT